jgi:hypothetical protein
MGRNGFTPWDTEVLRCYNRWDVIHTPLRPWRFDTKSRDALAPQLV